MGKMTGTEPDSSANIMPFRRRLVKGIAVKSCRNVQFLYNSAQPLCRALRLY